MHPVVYHEVEPYPLAWGKWAVTLTRCASDGAEIDERAFYGGPIFDSEEAALRYGIAWVASRGGRVRKTLLRALSLD